MVDPMNRDIMGKKRKKEKESKWGRNEIKNELEFSQMGGKK